MSERSGSSMFGLSNKGPNPFDKLDKRNKVSREELNLVWNMDAYDKARSERKGHINYSLQWLRDMEVMPELTRIWKACYNNKPKITNSSVAVWFAHGFAQHMLGRPINWLAYIRRHDKDDEDSGASEEDQVRSDDDATKTELLEQGRDEQGLDEQTEQTASTRVVDRVVAQVYPVDSTLVGDWLFSLEECLQEEKKKFAAVDSNSQAAKAVAKKIASDISIYSTVVADNKQRLEDLQKDLQGAEEADKASLEARLVETKAILSGAENRLNEFHLKMEAADEKLREVMIEYNQSLLELSKLENHVSGMRQSQNDLLAGRPAVLAPRPMKNPVGSLGNKFLLEISACHYCKNGFSDVDFDAVFSRCKCSYHPWCAAMVFNNSSAVCINPKCQKPVTRTWLLSVGSAPVSDNMQSEENLTLLNDTTLTAQESRKDLKSFWTPDKTTALARASPSSLDSKLQDSGEPIVEPTSVVELHALVEASIPGTGTKVNTSGKSMEVLETSSPEHVHRAENNKDDIINSSQKTEGLAIDTAPDSPLKVDQTPAITCLTDEALTDDIPASSEKKEAAETMNMNNEDDVLHVVDLIDTEMGVEGRAEMGEEGGDHEREKKLQAQLQKMQEALKTLSKGKGKKKKASSRPAAEEDSPAKQTRSRTKSSAVETLDKKKKEVSRTKVSAKPTSNKRQITKLDVYTSDLSLEDLKKKMDAQKFAKDPRLKNSRTRRLLGLEEDPHLAKLSKEKKTVLELQKKLAREAELLTSPPPKAKKAKK